MNEPRGLELIERYKRNYGISSEAPISEEMILRHWQLEKELTQKLMSSDSKNRFKIFEECYSKLYLELEWLNAYVNENVSYSTREKQFQEWLPLIGAPSKRIYEVGSGKAELISFLARNGHSCTATEITKERGKKYSVNNIIWRNSDGVHLGNFERPESYDVVISDQVIEHIHPDDTQDHFRGAYEILKPKGKYIFRVPHRFTGPHDISRVFKCEKALGMHLREMTFYEIRGLAKCAGFSNLGVVLTGSRRRYIRLFSKDGIVSISMFLNLLISIESIIAHILETPYKKRAIQIASCLGFFHNIFVVATK